MGVGRLGVGRLGVGRLGVSHACGENIRGFRFIRVVPGSPPRVWGKRAPDERQAVTSLFQSTPPHEGELGWMARSGWGLRFNPRPRTRANPRRSPSGSLFAGFNPRPRTRANFSSASVGSILLSFNPRPRTRANLTVDTSAFTVAEFQSTPPHEGELVQEFGIADRRGFNPRPRTRANEYVAAVSAGDWWFQSTPPHEGEPGNAAEQGVRGDVSIHAPARGRTVVRSSERAFDAVSIHAPARGRTSMLPQYQPAIGGFNPHPRTRANPWGPVEPCVPACFNPRPRTRANPCALGWTISTACFNPRPRTRANSPRPTERM